MLRIGTRGSRLALWQANYVAGLLRALPGAPPVEIVEILTAGDQVRDVPLAKLGGEGAVNKEIQRALLAGQVDVAVHSLKDLPTQPVEGLTLAAVPPRGPTGDVFVSQRHRSFDALPPGAVVATSSLRRQAQARHRRPDVKLADIRGNVETRLRKLAEQGLDGLILARAGLERLGLGDAVTEVLDPAWMLPAVGQAALALVRQLDDPAARQAVRAERALLRTLQGGCQVPLGVVATIRAEGLSLRGAVLSPDGSRRIEQTVSGPAADAEALGERLAADLLAAGARDLLAARRP